MRLSRVTHKSTRRYRGKVYDLKVKDVHSYSVDDIVVHNSAAGSIVVYALDITTLDPIKHDLVFERFLNENRVSLPDIDIDICKERREEVIEYVKGKYGQDNVAQIITFGTLGGRSVVRDICRALKIKDYVKVGDTIAKAIPLGSDLGDALHTVEFLQEQQKLYPDVFRIAERMSGRVRQAGIHAAAVIITPEPVYNTIPLYYSAKNKNSTVIQWDMYDAEEAGFLKMDFLGLNTLTVIDHAVNYINKNKMTPDEFNIESIDLEDKQTLELFNDGKTVGIFQLERKYVQEFCRQMEVHCFNDVVLLNALIRPGTADAGTIQSYIARRKGEENVEYPHPSLEDCLKSTLGFPVYQEQLMQMVQAYAGFSLPESDDLRRVVGKKKVKEMPVVERKFITMAVEKMGRDQKEAEEIFGLIKTFANYGFNLAHAAAYGKIAFQTAYLKAHFPTVFMVSLLNSELGNTDKIGQYLEECRAMGINVVPPSIKRSKGKFHIDKDGSIVFGLEFIKSVSAAAVKEVAKANDSSSFIEFLMKTNFSYLRANAVDNLIKVGAFSCYEEDRDRLLRINSTVRSLITKKRDQDRKIKMGKTVRKPISDEEIMWAESGEEYESNRCKTMEEVLNDEIELTGAYLTNSPLAPFIDRVKEETTTDVVDIIEAMDSYIMPKGEHVIAGIIKEPHIHIVKKGKSEGQEMAFFRLADRQRELECVVFPKQYKEVKDKIQSGKVALVKGKVDGGNLIVGIRRKDYEQDYSSDIEILSTI